MSTWQSIETAPKDGTAIDLWTAEFEIGVGGKVTRTECGRVAGAYWGTVLRCCGVTHRVTVGDVEQWVCGSASIGIDEVEMGRIRATHWMPLPTPPAQETDPR